jgi:hypothetical protein
VALVAGAGRRCTYTVCTYLLTYLQVVVVGSTHGICTTRRDPLSGNPILLTYLLTRVNSKLQPDALQLLDAAKAKPHFREGREGGRKEGGFPTLSGRKTPHLQQVTDNSMHASLAPLSRDWPNVRCERYVFFLSASNAERYVFSLSASNAAAFVHHSNKQVPGVAVKPHGAHR